MPICTSGLRASSISVDNRYGLTIIAMAAQCLPQTSVPMATSFLESAVSPVAEPDTSSADVPGDASPPARSPLVREGSAEPPRNPTHNEVAGLADVRHLIDDPHSLLPRFTRVRCDACSTKDVIIRLNKLSTVALLHHVQALNNILCVGLNADCMTA